MKAQLLRAFLIIPLFPILAAQTPVRAAENPATGPQTGEPCVRESGEVLPKPFLGDIVPVLERSREGDACPDNLRQAKSVALPPELPTLCDAFYRYRAAVRLFQARTGESADSNTARRISDLMAPRFINGPDWENAKKKHDGNPDAWTVYDPAPKTWKNWMAAADKLDAEAQRNSRASEIPTISLSGLTTTHKTGLNDLLDTAGKFRTEPEYGRAITKDWSMPLDQALAIKKFEVKALKDPRKNLMTWQPTECLENRSKAWQKEYEDFDEAFDTEDWKEVSPKETFRDEKGVVRQCGFITYAPPEEVQPQLHRLLGEINHATRTWRPATAQGAEPVDPIAAAARAQRYFVSIHPFVKGNGRTSRFVMDWMLQSAGLPTPVLGNMDDDIGTSQDAWAKRVGAGIYRSIQIVEHCAEDPAAKGCALVSPYAPDVRPAECPGGACL